LKLDVHIRGNDVIALEKLLNGGNDKALLKLFRDETTLIVLMVRVRNQERREVWETAQAEKEAEERIDLFSNLESEN